MHPAKPGGDKYLLSFETENSILDPGNSFPKPQYSENVSFLFVVTNQCEECELKYLWRDRKDLKRAASSPPCQLLATLYWILPFIVITRRLRTSSWSAFPFGINKVTVYVYSLLYAFSKSFWNATIKLSIITI